MMEKTFNSKQIEPIESDEPKVEFPVGTKFMLNNMTYIVTRAWVDSGVDRRHLSGPNGADQIVTIQTLQKDAEAAKHGAGDMRILELTPSEKLFIQYMSGGPPNE